MSTCAYVRIVYLFYSITETGERMVPKGFPLIARVIRQQARLVKINIVSLNVQRTTLLFEFLKGSRAGSRTRVS
jgi:hypothetical protein